jgi:hypothetical protein
MKKIKVILTLIFIICQLNILFSQIKTPYEKKQEEVAIKYLKKMGVSISEINRAKNADQSGMLLSLLIAEKVQIYQYSQGMKYLILMTEWEKELKAAEKFKGEVDYRKEREKAKKELNKKIETQKKYEEQKLLEKKAAEKLRIAEQNEQERKQLEYLIKNSDLEKIKLTIRNSFIDWVNKGEYETNEEHLLRLNNKHKILDSLCFYKTYDLIQYRYNAHGNEKNYYSIKLFKYDAENNLYPIELKIESGWDDDYPPSNSILDTIHADVTLAKKLKSNAEFDEYNGTYKIDFSNNLKFSNNIREWMFDEMGYLFPKSFSLLDGEFNHQIKSNMNTADNISISSSNLMLDKYFTNEYISNTNKYMDILLENKRNIILSNAERYLLNGDLDNAKKMFLTANKLKYSDDVKYKIKDVENKLIEFKKTELINEADQYYSLGKISKSIEIFKQANQLKESIQLTEKIANLNKSLQESFRFHDNLDSLFNIVISKKENLFKNIVDVNQLGNFKKKYIEKYLLCKQIITNKVDSDWSKIESVSNQINTNRNREVIEDRMQNLLEEINKFEEVLNKNSNFEKEIQKALLSKNKKFLKILKDDNINTIIEAVINPSAAAQNEIK